MKVRITKVPKVKKYQALMTPGQVEDPFYIPNSFEGQQNSVNAPIDLQTNQDGSLAGSGVFQPDSGLALDKNNQTVNLNNVNDNLTNEQTPANDINKGLRGTQTEKGQSKAGKFLRKMGPQKGMEAYMNRQNFKDFITNIAEYKSKKDLDKQAVKGFHSSQSIAATTQGTFDPNSMNNFTPGMLNTVPSTGDFAAAPYMPMAYYGGQHMAYGGRVFNQVAPNALPDRTSEPRLAVSNTLQPVPRELANIEAEKDETIYFLNSGGLPAHYKIGGQPHSKGGTPLNVPEDSFVFSKALKLKDKRLFPYFDVSKPTSFSDIAKKYDINKFRKTLANPDSDRMQVDTAEKMIGNYNLKLGMLALAQESTKGFPQGLPMIAAPFTTVNSLDPQMILPTPPQGVSDRAMQQMPEEEMMEQPMAKFGGSMKVRIKSLPSYQSYTTQGDVSGDMLSDAGLTDGSQPVYTTPPANIPAPPVPVAPVVVPAQPVATQVVTPPPIMTMPDGTVINTTTGQPVVSAPKQTPPKKKSTTTSQSSNNFDIDVMEGNPDFWGAYTGLTQSGKIKPELAIGFESAKERLRKSKQKLRTGTKNVFGDRDIHKGELFEDFKKRQAWYFKDKANWNYESIADVKDFQKKYCERAAAFGVKGCYFNPTDIVDDKGRLVEGTTFDGNFGEHTFNAPGFNEAEPAP